MGIFRKLNERGITVILVTHEPDIAAWADRNIKVKDGLVVEDTSKKTPAKKEAPAHIRIPKSMFLSRREISENMVSSINSIISNKTRSLLTMLGIIIGVGALIAMLAVGTGAQRAIQKQMSSLGTNLLAVMPGSRSQGGMSLGRGAVSRLTLEDARALAKLPNITKTDSTQGSQLVYGSKITAAGSLAYCCLSAMRANLLRPLFRRTKARSEKVAVLGTKYRAVRRGPGRQDHKDKQEELHRDRRAVLKARPGFRIRTIRSWCR